MEQESLITRCLGTVRYSLGYIQDANGLRTTGQEPARDVGDDIDVGEACWSRRQI